MYTTFQCLLLLYLDDESAQRLSFFWQLRGAFISQISQFCIYIIEMIYRILDVSKRGGSRALHTPRLLLYIDCECCYSLLQ